MRYHCIKCNEDDVHVHAGDGYHFGCSGRAIPIATICDPPEPTVIEASDLVPGMVGKIDDVDLVTMDVHVDDDGLAWAQRIGSICDPSGVRYVAGRGTPC